MTAVEISRDLGEIPEDFMGRPIQWQRLPDRPEELVNLLTNHKCIVDIDSLDVDALKNLASVTKFPDIFNFWVWSRSRGDLRLQVSRCKSESLILAPAVA